MLRGQLYVPSPGLEIFLFAHIRTSLFYPTEGKGSMGHRQSNVFNKKNTHINAFTFSDYESETEMK